MPEDKKLRKTIAGTLAILYLYAQVVLTPHMKFFTSHIEWLGIHFLITHLCNMQFN